MTTTVSTDIQNTRNARRIERDRQRRIAQDERAERKRSRKNGFTNVANPRKSTLLTIVCAVFAIYCLFPFLYILINSTKTQADFTSTFGLGFGKTFALWDNIKTVFTYQDGIFRPLVPQHAVLRDRGRRGRHIAGDHGRICHWRSSASRAARPSSP